MQTDEGVVNEGEDGDIDLFVGVVNQRGKSSTERNVGVMVNQRMIQCQIETGAQANIMSAGTAEILKIQDKLKKSSTRIFTFSGEKVQIIGDVDLKIYYKQQILCFILCNIMYYWLRNRY